MGYEQGASVDKDDNDNVVMQGQQCCHCRCPHTLPLSRCWMCEDEGKGKGKEIDRMMTTILLHEDSSIIIIIAVLPDMQGWG